MARRWLFTLVLLVLCLSACSRGGQKKGGKEPELEPESDPSDKSNPVVLVETSMGAFKVELYENKAPITVKNFLQYVDDKFYDGTIFHRVIPDFMIQGGGFEPGMREKRTREMIKNESYNGLSNRRGTLAMARTPRPDSASAQWFVNVTDNHFLNRSQARDGVGYAVFGKVIEGMETVDKIKVVPTRDVGDHEKVPVQDVMIKSIRRVEAAK